MTATYNLSPELDRIITPQLEKIFPNRVILIDAVTEPIPMLVIMVSAS